MELNYESIVPLYEQIMESIKQEMHSGNLAPHQKLPTEDELSTQYGVSRITIRRAIAELVKLGLVEKKQGKGTFVAAPKLRKAFNRPGMSFTEICAANGMKASAKILFSGVEIPQNEQVVKWLGLKPGTQAVRILRLRYADGRPLVIEDNYFSMEYAYLLAVDLEHNSLYHYLREKKGIEIIPGEVILRLVRADSKTAKLLEVSRGTPMLQIDSCTRKGDGDVLHTCHQVGYGEDFDFIVR
ncbi:GntR family transcriptional regulator [Caproicibacterium sp. BJN0003]|uniref:GntR family transcriptional regulator n=1 Tax=Caproicibacterium sp. BJN0003 TaxID=2994078 RepID=UPI00225A9FBA|nr:GntR family transcriptional regulator [Caproicibacterium sp. BJN0003]UZT81943.1 GntR family transcriptional regulator [Caproicibacterium sp. BJN0003]